MKNIGLRFVLLVAAAVACVAHAAPFAYIPEANGNVSVMNVENLSVVATIPLGGSPYGIAVNPGGRRAYVTNPPRAEVSIIDTAAQGVIANIPVAGNPMGAVLNTAENRLFVVHNNSGPGGVSTLSVINTENQQFITSVALGLGAQRIVMNPTGSRLFISNTQGNSITVVDAVTYGVIATIPTPDGPLGMVVDPAGQRLYVAQFGNATGGISVTVIDIATNTVVSSVRVGFRPDSLVFHPNATRLFVTNRNSDTVSVIDPGSLAVTATIPTGQGPAGIDITPLADFVYVANSIGNTVTVIHADIPVVFNTVTVGSNPRAIGRFFGGTTPFAAQTPGILSGLWWNPAESGWGIHLTQRRSTVFGAWFTYDAVGVARWYVASNCAMSQPLPCADCVDNSFCSGQLFEVSGPRFFRDRFDPSLVVASSVGVVQMEFRNKDSARMSYVVGNRTRQVNISRQPIAVTGVVPAVNYTDLWWNPSESGWGLGITQQFNIMFLTWFVYDDAGRPVWYVASNCDVISGGNGCRGTLYRTNGPVGPVASDTFISSAVRVTTVGTIDVAFTDSNNGVITYTVDGVGGSKTITRQIF